MITRRHFLGVSSIAAAGVASGCGGPDETGSGSGGTDGTGELPPSIASLASRAHEPVPISADERRARIEKARRLMAEHGMDGLMLTGGTSLVYFTNIRWGHSTCSLRH